MSYQFSLLLLASSAFMAPAYAGSSLNVPFHVNPVSDFTLSEVRGTSSAYAPLTRGSLKGMANEQSQMNFGLQGTIGNIQMQVWWGTIGSELIANNIRAQL